MIQAADQVRCMLVLSGRESLFADMRSASEPAARFFWGIELSPFSREETHEAIEKPLAGTGVLFDSACMDRIFDLTQGHPYFVQVFAYNLFSVRAGDRITPADLENNYPRILAYLGKRMFMGVYARASANERKILHAFAASRRDVMTNSEIAALSRVKSTNIYLKNLSESPAPLLVRAGRGRYSLFHPLFAEYLKNIRE
jgi:hypothetical protein